MSASKGLVVLVLVFWGFCLIVFFHWQCILLLKPVFFLDHLINVFGAKLYVYLSIYYACLDYLFFIFFPLFRFFILTKLLSHVNELLAKTY